MHDLILGVNWEHVSMVIIAVLTAIGAVTGLLKKMCSKIQSTHLDVEAHRDEIQQLVKEILEMMRKE